MIVFISYAKEDSERAKQVYRDLKRAGYQPWMDVEDIAPGQNWKVALQSAISKCDAAIVCLSTKSVSKTGYVQVEVKEFLDQRRRRPEGAIYLIPARLEPCQIPTDLADLHYADLFEKGGWTKVLASFPKQVKSNARYRNKEKLGLISRSLRACLRSNGKVCRGTPCD